MIPGVEARTDCTLCTMHPGALTFPGRAPFSFSWAHIEQHVCIIPGTHIPIVGKEQ
jgi:hypothetical protein